MATKVGTLKGNTGPTGDTGVPGTTGPVPSATISTDSGNSATLGTDSQLYVPTPVLASSSSRGLLRQLSNQTTDLVDGTNNYQDQGSAIRPVIWSVRQNSYNAVSNPNFEVDQRKAGSGGALGAGGAASTWIQDRWYLQKGVNGAAKAQPTQALITTPGANFAITQTFLRFSLTLAQANLAASDYLILTQTVEGSAARELILGVSSISVLVRTSIAGLSFGVELNNPASTYSLTKLCTISSADTWILILLANLPIFPSAGNFGLTPGTIGYQLRITLAAGSTYMSPANDTWQSGNFFGATGQSNFLGQAVNSTFDIAFIQHQPGPECSSLIDKPFLQNLDECCRYYSKNAPYAQKLAGYSGWHPLGYLVNNVVRLQNVRFPVRMAKVPTVTIYDTAGVAGNIHVDYLGATGISSYNFTSGGSGGTQDLAQVTLVSTPAQPTGTTCLGSWEADTGW